MKILIIEDDANKLSHIEALLHGVDPAAQITTRMSYRNGLKACIGEGFDLLVLDMTLPTYDVTPTDRGGKTRFYAGQEILREMQRRKILVPAVIVTQFEAFGEGPERKTLGELVAMLRREFPEHYRGAVYYHPAQSDWRDQLTGLVQGILVGQGNAG